MSPRSDVSLWERMRYRTRDTARWLGPVVRSAPFWLGLVGVLVGLFALYLFVNNVAMPLYTRQGAAITVPEVREMPYEQAVRFLEGRDLRPERRDQPFNPSVPRDQVLDQNPAPNATVKPGRRIYLYVNSGVERMVQVPEVRTQSESLARSQLRELGFTDITTRRDDRFSPYPGTVTRQQPESGTRVRTGEQITLWVSPGLGPEEVEVPDVRGQSAEGAMRTLEGAGLWVDPTRPVTGTITRQEPGPGSTVRQGAEVRLSSAPIEEDSPPYEDEVLDDVPVGEEQEEPSLPEPVPDTPPEPPRDPSRTDW